MLADVNWEELFIQHGVPHEVQSNSWIGLHCPHCYSGDGKRGLGVSPSGRMSCFKCGPLPLIETLETMLRMSGHAVHEELKRFSAAGKSRVVKADSRAEAVELPGMTRAIKKNDIFWRYLKSRGYDPAAAIDLWKLQGCDAPAGEWAWRLIIPYLNERGELLTYQGRDVTERSKTRYRNLPNVKSLVGVKETLYGAQHIQDLDRVVVTEGVTKVWRLGVGAVSTGGVSVTDAQVKLLSRYRRRYILFDNDAAGKERAKELGARLCCFSGETEIIWLERVADPSALSEGSARRLMKSLE